KRAGRSWRSGENGSTHGDIVCSGHGSSPLSSDTRHIAACRVTFLTRTDASAHPMKMFDWMPSVDYVAGNKGTDPSTIAGKAELAQDSPLTVLGTDWQCHGERASPLRIIGDVPAVAACNLPDQGEAEPSASRAESAWNAVEGRKQPLARFFPDHGSMVEHVEHGSIILLRDGHLDGRLAMEFRIFDQVADHSTQQHRIPAYHDRLCFEGAVVVSRAFLSRQCRQVDVLTNIQLLGGVEAADKQDLIYEVVEFGDISLELRFAFGMCCNQLEPEPDPRQRCSQLVGCIGEQHLMRIDQAFDPSCCLIEALRQTCNFVTPLDLDARREVAGPQRLDAALQSLEPSREPSHDWAGAERNH